MRDLAAIAGGAVLGAWLRYAVSLWGERLMPAFPAAGTLVVNIAGCLVVGSVMALSLQRPWLSRELVLLIVTGFLGSLTTFSAFGFQTVVLVLEQRAAAAAVNVAANLLLGLGAAWLGWRVTTAILAS